MNDIGERRRFQRVKFCNDAQLIQGEYRWSCELRDISLKGVLLNAPEPDLIASDQHTEVMITLAEDANITMICQLARREGSLLGLRCQEIDLESIRHLRRLIELNLGDAAASERELSELFVTQKQNNEQ